MSREAAQAHFADAAVWVFQAADGPACAMEVPIGADGTYEVGGVYASQVVYAALTREGVEVARASEEELYDILAMAPMLLTDSGQSVYLELGGRLYYGSYLTFDFRTSDGNGTSWVATCANPALAQPGSGYYTVVDGPANCPSGRWSQVELIMFYGPGGPGYEAACAAGVWPSDCWPNDATIASYSLWERHLIFLHILISDTFSSSLSYATVGLTDEQKAWVTSRLVGLDGSGGWFNHTNTLYRLSYEDDQWGAGVWPGWEGEYTPNDSKIKGFDCYLVWTSSYTQPIVVAGYFSPQDNPGSCRVRKASANPSITEGNPCYSLAGAKFGLYTEEACANLAGTMETGEDGASGAITGLAAGTYWLRELEAPLGYLLDTNAVPVTVAAGEEATVVFEDQPGTDPAVILVKKVDKDTGEASPLGAGTLAGAEFTVRFYDGWYDDLASLPASPTRSWVFTTNENGLVYLDAAHLVSGDELYTAADGGFTLPNGTVTFQETKAPEGYLLDDPSVSEPQQIRHGGQLAMDVAFNTRTVSDTGIRGGVSVQKADSVTGLTTPQGKATFEGAQFAIRNANDVSVTVGGVEYAPGEDVLTITTDKSGYAATAADALPYGTYAVRETVAPAGYLITEGEETVVIAEGGVIVPATHGTL